MKHFFLWLLMTVIIAVIFIITFSIFVDSMAIAISLSGFLVILANSLARFLFEGNGFEVLVNAILQRRQPDSTQKGRKHPITIKEYLEGRNQSFVEFGKPSFVPMVYKTVEKAILKDQTFYGSPLEIYRKRSRFVLVGLPGVGKSKVLEELFKQISTLHLEEPSGAPVPLWIDLNDPGNPVAAHELFQYWCSPEKYNLDRDFDNMLAIHAPVLLLDGLNEMPIESRANRAASLRDWLEDHPTVRAIITCRVRDYNDDQSISLGPFISEVSVEPFEREQISQFLQEAASDPHNDLTAEQANKLMAEIDEDDAVFRLAQIPLHLGMLTGLSSLRGEYRKLPNRLKALYAEYLEERYKWEKSNHKKNISLEWKPLQQCMEKLAYKMVARKREREVSLRMSETMVRKIVGRKALRDAYNLCLLVKLDDNKGRKNPKSNNVQFFHQSLHGFFALPRLIRALQGIEGSRILRIFRTSLNNIPVIVRQIGDLGDTAEMAVDTLIPLLQNEDAAVQRAAKNALIDIGIPAINPMIRDLSHENILVRQMAKEILIKIGEPVKGPLLLYALKYDEEHTNELIASIMQTVPNVPHKLVVAIRQRRTDLEGFRGWVAEALGKIRSSRAVQPLLSMLDDDDFEVRQDVAWALGEIGDRTAIQPIVDRLKVEKDSRVRPYAARAIRMIGKEAVWALMEALNTRNISHQSNIRKALYKLFNEDEETASIVNIVEEEILSGYPDKKYLDSIIETFTKW